VQRCSKQLDRMLLTVSASVASTPIMTLAVFDIQRPLQPQNDSITFVLN
jgi:hypothetical protein